MPPEPERLHDPGPERPELHVVPDLPTTEPDSEPDVEAPDAGVTPQAPWTARAADAARRLPAAWSRPGPSFADQVAYSRFGDWTADERTAKRALHLAGTLVCLLVKFLIVRPLDFATDTPTRFVIAVSLITIAALI